MRLLKSTLFMVLLIAAIAAATLNAVPTKAQDGSELTEFTSGDVRFVYPTGLASGITEIPVEAVAFDPETMPVWASNPAYTRYEFADYATVENAYYAPVISIYPVPDLQAYTLHDGDVNYGYAVEVDNLIALVEEQPDLADYTLLASAGSPDVPNLPFLPPANAAQVFRAQAEYIQFDDGMGIRYLTYYSQAVNEITERDIFYTFQGISYDGATYVSVMFPIVTGLLPAEFNPDLDYEAFAANYMTYLQETADALNAQAPELFTPNLLTLDAIMLSLSINGTIDYVPMPEATAEAAGG